VPPSGSTPDCRAVGGAELVAETRRGDGSNRASHFISISAAERSPTPDPNFDLRLGKPIDQSALRRALLAARRKERPAQAGLWEPGDRASRPDAQK